MDKFFDLAPNQTPSSGLPYVRKVSKRTFARIWEAWEDSYPVQQTRVIRKPNGDVDRLEIRLVIPCASAKDDDNVYVLYLKHTVFNPVVQQELSLTDKEKS